MKIRFNGSATDAYLVAYPWIGHLYPAYYHWSPDCGNQWFWEFQAFFSGGIWRFYYGGFRKAGPVAIVRLFGRGDYSLLTFDAANDDGKMIINSVDVAIRSDERAVLLSEQDTDVGTDDIGTNDDDPRDVNKYSDVTPPDTEWIRKQLTETDTRYFPFLLRTDMPLNADIAKELAIQPNTVNKQLKMLYRKLLLPMGSDKHKAATRIRELGLHHDEEESSA